MKIDIRRTKFRSFMFLRGNLKVNDIEEVDNVRSFFQISKVWFL